MIIYGTALLAVSYLLGVFLGGLLGQLLGVDANIGGEPPRLYRRVIYLSQAAMPDRVKLS